MARARTPADDRRRHFVSGLPRRGQPEPPMTECMVRTIFRIVRTRDQCAHNVRTMCAHNSVGSKVTASVSMSHTLPASLDAAAPRFRLMERMTSRKVMIRKRFTITPKMANVRGSVVPSVDDVPPHCCRFRFTAVCRPPRRPDTLCSVYHLSLRWKESLPVDRCCERSFVCEYNEQSKHEGCRLVLHRRRRWFGFG